MAMGKMLDKYKNVSVKSKRSKRRSGKQSLLKKIKGSPLNGTLITPVPCGRPVDLSVGAVNPATSDDIDAIRYSFGLPQYRVKNWKEWWFYYWMNRRIDKLRRKVLNSKR